MWSRGFVKITSPTPFCTFITPMFPPALRAQLLLVIIYVAAVSAAPPTNPLPEGPFAIASRPGSRPTSSGGSVSCVSGYTMNLRTNGF